MSHSFITHVTPWRNALLGLLQLGLVVGPLLTLVLAAVAWPLQCVPVYLGLVLLVGLGAVVEYVDIDQKHRETELRRERLRDDEADRA
ncbi:hypothetical protein [Kutzneria albida]|uniref:Uncharacterized protein n=1 Tax=Kutzneria albida DSM 43870 TaxID=1449976 RepID=W5WD69_9PSEU|nr:hypothetical protein [Kutzneria albida]AHH98531.1 hypothetical protein KALB_5169 [Kutzneria albida DSM 43870]